VTFSSANGIKVDLPVPGAASIIVRGEEEIASRI